MRTGWPGNQETLSRSPDHGNSSPVSTTVVFMRELGQKRERTREEVEAIYVHALLLGLDSTELDDEWVWTV